MVGEGIGQQAMERSARSQCSSVRSICFVLLGTERIKAVIRLIAAIMQAIKTN
jgi:hypothetical protein